MVIGDIASMHGSDTSNTIKQAIVTYSVSESVIDGVITSTPVEVTEGLRLLSQLTGSLIFVGYFFLECLDANKLLNTITDH